MPSFPVRLDKAFIKGIIKTYKFEQGAFVTYKIPKYTAILILSGVIHHVSGTASRFSAYNGAVSSELTILTTIIASATTNGDYSLFNTVADENQAQQPMLLILNEGDTMQFVGAAGSHINVRVLEWEY